MKRTLLVLGMVLALAMTAMADAEPEYPEPGITSPTAGEVVYENTLYLEGYDTAAADNDVQWAVRFGTCEADADANRAGNVANVNDTFTWNDGKFESTVDITGWDPGLYCFVLNTTSGEADGNRLTQEFYIADGRVAGGGQILEGDYKVSFGGDAYAVEDVGGKNIDGLGSWTVRFHEVSTEGVSKSTFTGDVVYDMNFFGDGSVANFKVDGTWDGAPGYTLIVRAEDGGEPGQDDNLRFELLGVYDTFGDFPGESDNFGSARTGLDRGNLQVDTR